jgi:hypothetical protein
LTEEQHFLTTIAYHWNQACASCEVVEKQCTLKAIEYWHKAAELAYDSSSLMEALRWGGGKVGEACCRPCMHATKLRSVCVNVCACVSVSGGGRMGDRERVCVRECVWSHPPLPTHILFSHLSHILSSCLPPTQTTRRLFQKASQLAEILVNSGVQEESPDPSAHDGHHNAHSFASSAAGLPSLNEEGAEGVVGRDYRGELNWALISRLTRAHWEKSMASCCLGMVLQHK